MKQNPTNAVLHLGHSNGVVSLWSPSVGKALVSMLCHTAAVTDISIDREGNYLATAGIDGYLKIWDLRKFGFLHAFKLDKPANALDISERGCLAVGVGRKVQILRDAFHRPTDVTYLNHEIRTPNAALSGGGGLTAASRALLSNVSVNSLKFRPLEDVLCVGHSHGISSLIVPGSGEPNFDSYENNPFLTTKQRREAEVQNLLNKLSPDMIVLGMNRYFHPFTAICLHHFIFHQ
jgi:U3 small nucleolar RNA-associated protein 7